MISPEALEFATRLHRAFNSRREELLARRARAPGSHRSWRAAAVSLARRRVYARTIGALRRPRRILNDRRVEITGPVERKMMINALNSGARVFMADLEDSLSPTWDNVVDGQRESVRRGSAHAVARHPGRKAVSPERDDRDARRAAARMAHGRVARARRRRADLGEPVRLRCLLLQQRASADRARHRDRTSICRSSRVISKRGSGTMSSIARRTSSAFRAERSAPRC